MHVKLNGNKIEETENHLVGEMVDAKHKDGQWHEATIASREVRVANGANVRESPCKVDWANGSEDGRDVRQEDVRPRWPTAKSKATPAAGSPKSGKTATAKNAAAKTAKKPQEEACHQEAQACRQEEDHQGHHCRAQEDACHQEACRQEDVG